MIDLDELNVDELVKILNESGFAEAVLTNPGNDEDWEKCRLPFAAWLKNGRSSEMMIENIEDAISLTDNQQGKWQLANFLKNFMRKEVENDGRSTGELKDYLEYRKAIEDGNIAEWALSGIKTEAKSAQSQVMTEPVNLDLVSMIASHDAEMVKRIGEWIKDHPKGIDITRLFIALIGTDELESTTKVTVFMNAMKISFPEVKLVGTRQVQKDVNFLQNLLPNGKRYGKDMPEHRSVIEMIKKDVLRKNLENID